MNLSERFFERNPARNWSDVAARAELTAYSEDLEDDVITTVTAPMPLVRRKLLPPPFAAAPILPVKEGRRIEHLGDHLLMRITGGWRVIRVAK